MFVSDLSDKFENIKKELDKCRKEFMGMFEAVLDQKLDEQTFAIFDPTVEVIHKNLRPKMSLVGFSGVGKTTITRLIMAEEFQWNISQQLQGISRQLKLGNYTSTCGILQAKSNSPSYGRILLKDLDAVLLITDSTLENCEKSKYFVELIKKEVLMPTRHVSVTSKIYQKRCPLRILNVIWE